MFSEFLVTTQRRGPTMTVICSGELDVSTCGKLNDAIELALDDEPSHLIFDGRGISLLTTSGITTLFGLVIACKERDIALELKLSRHARQILDLVGLWWLGVVHDGLAIEGALADALRAYAHLASEERPTASLGDMEPGE
jgi:anti-anti-sigma regulatory factor